jgi:hypothetical protein
MTPPPITIASAICIVERSYYLRVLSQEDSDRPCRVGPSSLTAPDVDDPTACAVRGAGIELARESSWLAATERLRQAHVEHPGLNRSAMGGRII